MGLSSPYSDNNKRPAPAATVGFKISKPGYNAQTASSSNMVFNSSWPSLPIAFETTITNPITTGSSTATVAHGLQFPPFVMVWYYYNDPSGISQCGGRFIALADRSNVYLNGFGNNTPPLTATKLKIRAFQLDLSKDIDYTLAPGDTFNLPYDNSYGVKVVKQGKDINSKDLRDFTIHSRAQSPLILAVKTEATSTNGANNVIQYTSVLNYPVWVYGFIKAGSTLAGSLSVPVNTYVPAPYYSQSYPKTFTDGFKSYLQWNSSPADNGATLVILRDPMFAANPVTVQY